MHLMRWLTNFYDFSFKWTATAAIGIHPTKAWLSQLVNFKNVIWTWGHFRRTICNKILFLNLEKNATETYGMLQTAFGASCMNWASVFEWHEIQGRQGVCEGWCVGGVRKSIHQSWLAKGLGLLCWGFKGVQEEISSEEASTLKIGSVAFPWGQCTSPQGQCTSPQLHPCHRLFEQDGHPYSPDVAPCDFWLFPKLRGCRYLDNWDERGCDEGHWHAHTRGLWWGLPEFVGMVQQVHCSWRRLLRRELEFHVCTINKSAHTKKSGNLFNGVYIYIYIYIYTHTHTEEIE